MKSTTILTPKLAMVLAMTALTSSVIAEIPSSYKNQKAAWDQHQSMRENTPYHGITWRNVGPIFQGGRAVDVIRPHDQPHVVYVGYASGGVWKSTNNGQTFKPVTDHLPSQIVGSLAIDPNDSNVLWLGTGENNSSRSSYGGMGIYQSKDGGETWAYKGLGSSDRIGRILVDHKDSNTIYVAALGKLYSKGGQRGLYRSSDGGDTWETLIEGKGYTGFIDVAQTPDGVLIATAWDRSRKAWDFVEGGEGSAVYRSEDGGDSWDKVTQGLPYGEHMGRLGITTSVSNPNVVYLSLDNQTPLPESEWDMGDQAVTTKRLKNMSNDEFLSQAQKGIESWLRANSFPKEMTAESVIEQVKSGELTPQDLISQLADDNANLFNVDIRSLEVYRSDDAGKSFYRTHKEDIQGVVYSYGYYFGQIKVDPQDENTVYATGVPLIKSTDGGKTWASSWNSTTHADFQALWINPKHANHIMTGNDGGVDESYDGGKTWKKVDQQPVGQFYTIAVDMETPYNIYGGLQDNGTLKGSSTTDWTRGESWERLFGGDGMHVNIDDADKMTYVGFQFGNYFRLSSGKAPKKINPLNYVGEESLRKNWNSPVMLSTHNPDIVYFAGQKLFRSMNKGNDWVEISDDLTRSKKRGNVPFATITSVSESPLKFGLIWAGTDDGMVWVTDNGGNDWRQVNKKLPKGKWVSRVMASPHEEKRAWLSLNGYRDDDIQPYLYRSDNLGKTWKKMAKGLPNETINVVKEDPKNENIVYVGTDKGIYVSTDLGGNWQMLGENLPTVPVHDLIVHPRENELVLGTHGRSVFVADVSPLQGMEKAVGDSELHIYPIEEIKEGGRWDSKVFPWNYTDDKTAPHVTYIWSTHAAEAQISITDDNESLLYSTTANLKKGLNQWHWDYKVDESMAVAAEAKALADKAENADEEDAAEGTALVNKAKTPYAESKRLGHPPFIEPGTYHLTVKLPEKAKHSVEFKVK